MNSLNLNSRQAIATYLSRLNINQKLRLAILGICSALLICALSILFVVQVIGFKQSFTKNISILAEIIADESRVDFDDPERALDRLQALRAQPEIVHASNDSVFVSYGPSGNWSDLKHQVETKSSRMENENLIHPSRSSSTRNGSICCT